MFQRRLGGAMAVVALVAAACGRGASRSTGADGRRRATGGAGDGAATPATAASTSSTRSARARAS